MKEMSPLLFNKSTVRFLKFNSTPVNYINNRVKNFYYYMRVYKLLWKKYFLPVSLKIFMFPQSMVIILHYIITQSSLKLISGRNLTSRIKKLKKFKTKEAGILLSFYE